MASTPEQKKQWHQKYLKRREKALEQQKEYRLTNYQKYKDYQQRYREAHREELRERQRQYREEHQEYYKDYWHNRWIGEPLPNVNDYQRPPVKNKEEERAVYEKWLKLLKLREPFLNDDRLYFNHLMQAEIERKLMARTKLTIEQIKDRYGELQERLEHLQKDRAKLTNDAEINAYTRAISKAKANLANFKSNHSDVLEGKKPKQHLPKTPLKTKLQQIEEKAKKLIANAKDDKEKKMWEERLMIVKLRYKYSYC